MLAAVEPLGRERPGDNEDKKKRTVLQIIV